MAIAAPPRPPVQVALGLGPPAPVEQEASFTAAWTLVGVLIAFKIVTITVVLVIAHPADNLVALLLAMNWVWLVPLVLLLGVIPFGYWLRLVRARAKRRRLQHAEWHVR